MDETIEHHCESKSQKRRCRYLQIVVEAIQRTNPKARERRADEKDKKTRVIRSQVTDLGSTPQDTA
jgi:hypothetical protein